MQITDYFDHIQSNLDAVAEISNQNITFDQRSNFIGYIRGDIYFIDDSRLHFSEYIDVEWDLDRIKYSYHFMRKDKFLFRYDNAPDLRARALRTYPHHKHTADGQIVESIAPTLTEVIHEIVSTLSNPVYKEPMRR